MKRFRFLAMMMFALMAAFTFTACGDDDDEDDGGSSSSKVDIVGKTFTMRSSDVDNEGYPQEDNQAITFTSSSKCSIHYWGYWYVWNNGYKKESHNETKTYSYTVSGSTITIKNVSSGDDKPMTYHGNYLTDATGGTYSLEQ